VVAAWSRPQLPSKGTASGGHVVANVRFPIDTEAGARTTESWAWNARHYAFGGDG